MMIVEFPDSLLQAYVSLLRQEMNGDERGYINQQLIGFSKAVRSIYGSAGHGVILLEAEARAKQLGKFPEPVLCE